MNCIILCLIVSMIKITIIAYHMMHKLTIITYLIKSLLKEHSVKNDQIFSLSIPTNTCYFPLTFYLF